MANDGSGKVTGTVGSNGLVNTLDNGDDYTDVNGSFDDSQADNFTDSDGDINTGGDVDYRDVPGVDTDNDGVIDADDLDDDNDGILDTEEDSCISFATGNGLNLDSAEFQNILSNFPTLTSFEDFESFSNGNNPNSLVYSGFSLSTTPTNSVISGSTYGTNPFSGSRQVNFPISNGVDNTVVITFNSPVIGFGLKFGDIHDGATPQSTFSISFDGTTIWSSNDHYTGGTGLATNDIDGTTQITVGNGIYNHFGYFNPSASISEVTITLSGQGTGDNFVFDDIAFITQECLNTDTDGDGIPNRLDLDSDNDGIPDVIESDGIDADKDGKADRVVGTSSNTNGVPSSAGTGNTPITTDADSLPDYLDIDADNDGIPDNIEGQTTSGYTAPSGVGTGITDVNQNGVDDNYEVGGNIGIDPTNTDNIDKPDYQDTNSDNDATDDVDENGDGDTFSATDSDGDGLVDVFDDNDDSGISGSTVNDGVTPTTTITNTTDIINAFGDADGDASTGGNVDYRDVPGLDTDNDGIADVDDLDDDNDGILDTAEGYTPESTSCTTINTPVAGVGGSSVQSGQAVAP